MDVCKEYDRRDFVSAICKADRQTAESLRRSRKEDEEMSDEARKIAHELYEDSATAADIEAALLEFAAAEVASGMQMMHTLIAGTRQEAAANAEPVANRDIDWILAMSHALGTNSGFNVPIVPTVEQFKILFDAIRKDASPPSRAGEPRAWIRNTENKLGKIILIDERPSCPDDWTPLYDHPGVTVPDDCVVMPRKKMENLQLWIDICSKGITPFYPDGTPTPNSNSLRQIASELKAMLAAKG